MLKYLFLRAIPKIKHALNKTKYPMKRLVLSFFALFLSAVAYPQATQVWCENFDGGTVNATSSGVPG